MPSQFLEDEFCKENGCILISNGTFVNSALIGYIKRQISKMLLTSPCKVENFLLVC